jgi:hypothetical protein
VRLHRYMIDRFAVSRCTTAVLDLTCGQATPTRGHMDNRPDRFERLKRRGAGRLTTCPRYGGHLTTGVAPSA